MTFQDVFKSSFLENVNAISFIDMALALTLAFCLGMFIFMIYKKTYNGVMYSSSFGGFGNFGSFEGGGKHPSNSQSKP